MQHDDMSADVFEFFGEEQYVFLAFGQNQRCSPGRNGLRYVLQDKTVTVFMANNVGIE